MDPWRNLPSKRARICMWISKLLFAIAFICAGGWKMHHYNTFGNSEFYGTVFIIVIPVCLIGGIIFLLIATYPSKEDD
jgi:TRAP-type C4-dicarboxylate transport system permease small subunit